MVFALAIRCRREKNLVLFLDLSFSINMQCEFLSRSKQKISNKLMKRKKNWKKDSIERVILWMNLKRQAK